MNVNEQMKELFTFYADKKEILEQCWEITKDNVLFTSYTGYTKIEQLSRSEKTMLGTRFEPIVRAELDIMKGPTLDCVLNTFEYDIKFTCRTNPNWMIPPECIGKICLLTHGGDDFFKAGIFVALESHLTKGGNRDSKKTVSKKGKESIRWLYK